MPVTDGFDRPDAGSLGPNWTNNDGLGLQVVSNTAQGVGAAYNGAYWSANAFNETQASQYNKDDNNSYVAAGVRMSAGSNWYAYFNNGDLQKSVGGSVTSIGGSGAYTAFDTALLNASGAALEGFVNGVSKVTASDAALVSGAPGLVTFGGGASMNNWQGTGEISAAPRRFLLVRR